MNKIELTDREKALMAYTVKIVALSLRDINRKNAHVLLDSAIEKQLAYHLAAIVAGLSCATEEDVILSFLKVYNASATLAEGMFVDFEECK